MGKKGSGRAGNRLGKFGSHLLRRALRELPPREVAPPNEADDSVNAPAASRRNCSVSLQELSWPLLTCGTTFQCQLMLTACEYFCDSDANAVPDEERQVLDRFLLTPARPQTSLTSEADKLQVFRKSFLSDLVCAASAVWHLGCAAWNAHLQGICRRIESHELEGIAVFRCRTYDETPLRLRVQTKSGTRAGMGSKAETSITKCMQTRYRLGVLVKDIATNRFLYCSGIVPTCLQGMERTRGEDICVCQQKVINSVPAADTLGWLCKASVDINIADRALANQKSEACLQWQRPQDTVLHMDCEVHKMSTSVTWCLKIVDLHISGIIASSIVLRQAGSLATFKEHLFEEIRSRLLIVHGCPDEGRSKAYRQQVYNTFLSDDLAREDDKKHLQQRRAQQKAILSRFLCGDLEHPTVEFYTQGVLATEDDVLDMLRSHVIPALVPGSMPVYARHRWLGGESAVDYVALLECHHKLFSTTVQRMFKTQQTMAPPADAAALLAVPEIPAEGWAAMEAEVLGAARDDANPLATLEAEIPGDSPAGKDPQDWAAFNRSMQKKMEAWAVGYDLGILALVRRVLTISSRVFFAMLRRSGSEWDDEQAKALSQGQPRSYRVTEALLSKDLDCMMDSTCAAFHEPPAAVPLQSMTRRHRVMMFSLLARLGGAAHFLIHSLREVCPYLPALLLEDASIDVAEAIASQPDCMHDAFCKKFLAMYGPTPDHPGADRMVSTEALAFLHGAYDLCELDVASIESRHAVVRHLQDTKNSTWQVILQTLSADHMLRQATLQNAAYHKLLDGLPPVAAVKKFPLQSLQKSSRRKKKTRPVQVQRNGGPQRAYFHVRMRELGRQHIGQRGLGNVYKRLHSEYRNLSAEQRAYYQQLGAAAVISRRAGQRAFIAGHRGGRGGQEILPVRSPAETGLRLKDQAVGLLQETRQKSRDAARAAAMKASKEQEALVARRQQRCLDDPCPVPVQVPCANLVPTLDAPDATCHSSQWCSPAVDLAKACGFGPGTYIHTVCSTHRECSVES